MNDTRIRKRQTKTNSMPTTTVTAKIILPIQIAPSKKIIITTIINQIIAVGCTPKIMMGTNFPFFVTVCIIIRTTSYMSFISTTHGKYCLSILSIVLFGSKYNKIRYNITQYTNKESTLKIIN